MIRLCTPLYESSATENASLLSLLRCGVRQLLLVLSGVAYGVSYVA